MRQAGLTWPVTIVMAVAGFAVVSGSGCGFIRGARETMSLRRVSQAEETAFRVYRQGTSPQAKDALLHLAKLLEDEEADWRGTPHGKGLAFDLSLTYGRLGLLAEHASDEQTERRYRDLARMWFGKSGQPPREDEAMRELILLADQSGDRGERASAQVERTR
jgi:hypothetical protein